jgi:hypothetical protein
MAIAESKADLDQQASYPQQATEHAISQQATEHAISQQADSHEQATSHKQTGIAESAVSMPTRQLRSCIGVDR